ncbi:MAG: DedA family protein [Coprobacillus sp.]
MFLENLIPPIPSEIILTFSGYLVTLGYFEIQAVIVVSTLGSFLGSICLYALGYLLSPIKQVKLFKLLHIQDKHIIKCQEWFENHGKKAVFLTRFVPVVRSLVSLPAGMMAMPLLPFCLYTMVGTLLWNTILVSAGVLLGENFDRVQLIIEEYKTLVIIGIVLYIVYRWFKKRKMQH